MWDYEIYHGIHQWGQRSVASRYKSFKLVILLDDSQLTYVKIGRGSGDTIPHLQWYFSEFGINLEQKRKEGILANTLNYNFNPV